VDLSLNTIDDLPAVLSLLRPFRNRIVTLNLDEVGADAKAVACLVLDYFQYSASAAANQLESLSLGSWPIGKYTAPIEVFKKLSQQTGLSVIRLRRCCLPVSALVPIAACLRCCAVLTLDLAWNTMRSVQEAKAGAAKHGTGRMGSTARELLDGAEDQLEASQSAALERTITFFDRAMTQSNEEAAASRAYSALKGQARTDAAAMPMAIQLAGINSTTQAGPPGSGQRDQPTKDEIVGSLHESASPASAPVVPRVPPMVQGVSLSTPGLAFALALTAPGVHLQRLDLSFSALDDSVGCAIAWALRGHRSLTHVDLSHNNLSGYTAFAMAGSLAFNSVLKELKLGFQPLGRDASSALVESLLTNTTLEALFIENAIGDPLVAAGGGATSSEILPTSTLLRAGRHVQETAALALSLPGKARAAAVSAMAQPGRLAQRVVAQAR
jgi:hypothetical protein